MIIRDVRPRCMSPRYKKNGHIHNGKQNHQCQDRGRQFVDCFEQYLVSDETRDLIERLLLERLSLRGICRAVGVGLKWLLGFMVTCSEDLPDHLKGAFIPTTSFVRHVAILGAVGPFYPVNLNYVGGENRPICSVFELILVK
jgi:hypothetical protein